MIVEAKGTVAVISYMADWILSISRDASQIRAGGDGECWRRAWMVALPRPELPPVMRTVLPWREGIEVEGLYLMGPRPRREVKVDLRDSIVAR